MSARAVRQLRDFRGIDFVRLETDPSSRLASVDTTLDVNTMVSQYENAVLSAIYMHAPLTVRMNACRRKDSIHEARALRRANEKKWRTTKIQVHRQIFVGHRTVVNNMIKRAKRAHYESVLSSLDQRTCVCVVTTLLKLTHDGDCSDYAIDFGSQRLSSELDRLLPTSEEEIKNIIRLCPPKTCSLDSCPTVFLKKTTRSLYGGNSE